MVFVYVKNEFNANNIYHIKMFISHFLWSNDKNTNKYNATFNELLFVNTHHMFNYPKLPGNTTGDKISVYKKNGKYKIKIVYDNKNYFIDFSLAEKKNNEISFEIKEQDIEITNDWTLMVEYSNMIHHIIHKNLDVDDITIKFIQHKEAMSIDLRIDIIDYLINVKEKNKNLKYLNPILNGDKNKIQDLIESTIDELLNMHIIDLITEIATGKVKLDVIEEEKIIVLEIVKLDVENIKQYELFLKEFSSSFKKEKIISYGKYLSDLNKKPITKIIKHKKKGVLLYDKLVDEMKKSIGGFVEEKIDKKEENNDEKLDNDDKKEENNGNEEKKIEKKIEMITSDEEIEENNFKKPLKKKKNDDEKKRKNKEKEKKIKNKTRKFN